MSGTREILNVELYTLSLRLDLFNFSITKNETIVPTATTPPREARAGVPPNLSKIRLNARVIIVLIMLESTCITPHDIASPIGYATSAQKEYPTPIIGTTDMPRMPKAMVVTYKISLSIMRMTNVIERIVAIPIDFYFKTYR